MDSRELCDLSEAYKEVYALDEKSVSWDTGRTASGVSPRYAAASPKLPLVAPKTTPRQARLNMSFDPFDIVKGHLLDEGYADTEQAALKIMVNMSEEWRENIVEAEVLSKLGGVEGTGVGKDFKKRSWTDTEKSRYSSYKKPAAPTAAPAAAAQKNNEFTKSGNMKQKVHTSGTVPGADGNYRAQSAKDKFYRSIASDNAADDIISWNKYDRNDPKVKQAAKDWADTHYRQNTALDTNDPNYDPRSTKYPDFSKFKRAH